VIDIKLDFQANCVSYSQSEKSQVHSSTYNYRHNISSSYNSPPNTFAYNVGAEVLKAKEA
jgi:hypothetical protein